jgi:hypothetical protein
MSLPTPPPKTFLRLGEVKAWLGEKGFSESKVADLVRTGVIKSHHIGGGRAFYYAPQIERDVLREEQQQQQTKESNSEK